MALRPRPNDHAELTTRRHELTAEPSDVGSTRNLSLDACSGTDSLVHCACCCSIEFNVNRSYNESGSEVRA